LDRRGGQHTVARSRIAQTQPQGARQAEFVICDKAIERTHSWLNRFRSILIRWAKKPANYLALLHFACAIITWRHALPG
jgi:transposase